MAEWFEEWFDSPYYHLLYRDRNHAEAEAFIEKLIDTLNLPVTSKVLDVACGSGRHALQFSKHGYQTTGLDLSPNSIATAKELRNDLVSFLVADMRTFKLNASFQLVTNLFTSFGYFSDLGDNLKALKTIVEHLEDDGLFILDFMNTSKVIQNLVSHSEKKVEHTQFIIERKLEDKKILKTILFMDSDGAKHSYTERVQAIEYKDFLELFNDAGLEVKSTFKDYRLEAPYDSEGDRMIFLCKKA